MTTVTPGRGLRRRLRPAVLAADRVFPAAARAVWHLDDGLYEFAHGAFVPETVVRDIPPSACADALPVAER